MKKIIKYIKAFLVLFAIITVCVAINNKNADAESIVVEETLDLENAIIIDGIKLNSGETEDDDFFAGEIIYHSDADLNKKDNQKSSKTNAKQASKKASAPQKADKPAVKRNLLDELRTDDPRWHLTTYKIKPKDNLWSIARRFDIDHKLILKANEIKNPSYLQEGKTILVPNKLGCNHTVKKGDTLISIAKKYNVEQNSITNANKIKGDTIRIGQELFIPGGQENIAVKSKKTISNSNNKVEVAKTVKPKTKNVKESKNIAFIWPLRGKITSGFGTRKDPFDGTRKFHTGIDISANEGTKVLAARKGTVIFSGWKDGYGNTVILRHENGYITVYAHNYKTLAENGSEVKTGDVIALSGQTGAVTGAHLHFEVRKYLTVLDPLRFLK